MTPLPHWRALKIATPHFDCLLRWYDASAIPVLMLHQGNTKNPDARAGRCLREIKAGAERRGANPAWHS